MNLNISIKIKFLFILLLIPSLVIINTVSLDAKSKKKTTTSSKKHSKKSKKGKKKLTRHFDVEKNREMAFQTIENSNELSQLASGNYKGIENSTSNLNAHLADEGEDLNELALEDDVQVDMDHVRDMYIAFTEGIDLTTGTLTLGGIDKKDLFDKISNWLGTPYLFGGTTDRAIDCSAFVLTMFKDAAGIHLPRTAAEQFTIGAKVKREELQFGDLIFFHTRRHAYISHVGIYLGDNLFAHASSRYGVTVSSLESTYYDKRFIGAKRLSTSDVVKFSSID